MNDIELARECGKQCKPYPLLTINDGHTRVMYLEGLVETVGVSRLIMTTDNHHLLMKRGCVQEDIAQKCIRLFAVLFLSGIAERNEEIMKLLAQLDSSEYNAFFNRRVRYKTVSVEDVKFALSCGLTLTDETLAYLRVNNTQMYVALQGNKV